MSNRWLIRALVTLLSSVAVAATAHAACGTIPSTYPVYGGSSMSIGNNSTVNGIKITGSGTRSLNPANGVKGNTTQSLPDIDPAVFPANGSSTNVNVPNNGSASIAAGNYDKIDAGNSSSLTFGAGTYNIKELKAGNDSTITFAPGTYYIEKFDGGGGMNVVISPAGAVRIYIRTDFKVGNNAQLNASGSVSNLQVYLYNNGEADLGSGVTLNGLIYGPGTGSEIKLGNNTVLTGAVITGGETDLGNSVTINYSAGTQSAIGSISSCATSTSIASFLMNIGAASASTCSAKSITITARDSSGATLTSYTGTINLTTSSARGDWAIATGAGTLNNGAANDGAATYAFAGADAGVVTLSLSNVHADDLTVTAVDSSVAGSSTTSSTINFRDNAFVLTLDPLQIAGKPQSIGVALWRRDMTTGNCAIATGYAGAKALDAWITRDALDPSGAAPTIGALTLPSAAPAANPTSNNLTLTFASGQTTITLATSDVGKYVLNLRDDTRSFASGVDITGSSSAITTRPFALGFTEIKKGAGTCSPPSGSPTCNAGGTATSGAKFVAAGDTFDVAVAGYLWSAADDVNSDGVPDAGADVTNNGVTPAFAWATTLAVSSTITPAGGVVGSLGGGASILQAAFSGGRAQASALTYSEVGSMSLTASATNFLGTSGVNVTGTSGVIGRFYPGRFQLLPGASVAAACVAGGFTYMGQSGITLGFTIEAQTVGGARTQNYFSTGYSTGSVGAEAENNDNGTNLAARISMPSSTWVAGRYIVTAGSAMLSRLAAPDGPFDSLRLGATVTDPDGALLAGRDMNASTAGNCIAAGNCTAATLGAATKVRFGRLRIGNASGSELLALSVPVESQYWNGTGFTRHTDDQCTTLTAANIALSAYTQRSGAVVSPTPTSITLPPGPMNAGTKLLTLSGPGVGKGGNADLAINLGTSATESLCISDSFTTTGANLSWLRGRWCGASYDRDPTGRITFGIHRAASPLVLQRENY